MSQSNKGNFYKSFGSNLALETQIYLHFC